MAKGASPLRPHTGLDARGKREPLLCRRHQRTLLQFPSLMPQHGGDQLPGWTRSAAPRCCDGDHAVIPCVWIEAEEPDVPPDQPLPFTRRGFGATTASASRALGRRWQSRQAAFLRAAFFAAGAASPLAAFLAAHRFFIASESALRAAALKCGFGLAVVAGFAQEWLWIRP